MVGMGSAKFENIDFDIGGFGNNEKVLTCDCWGRWGVEKSEF